MVVDVCLLLLLFCEVCGLVVVVSCKVTQALCAKWRSLVAPSRVAGL